MNISKKNTPWILRPLKCMLGFHTWDYGYINTSDIFARKCEHCSVVDAVAYQLKREIKNKIYNEN